MSIKPGCMHNPFKHGFDATKSKTTNWPHPYGYDYRNHLATIHPDYRWCKILDYVVDCEERSVKAQREGYREVCGVICSGIWSALSNAGYIEYVAKERSYRPTKMGHDCIEFIKSNFNRRPTWFQY